MRHGIFVSLTAALSAAALVSATPDLSGHSEFHMGVLLPRQQEGPRANLQPFAGKLGGAVAPAITNSGDPKRPFMVDGNTFTDFASAADRACDNQKNACADLANKGGNKVFKVSDCDQQNQRCKSAASSAGGGSKVSPPSVLVSSTPEFDIFCDA